MSKKLISPADLQAHLQKTNEARAAAADRLRTKQVKLAADRRKAQHNHAQVIGALALDAGLGAVNLETLYQCFQLLGKKAGDPETLQRFLTLAQQGTTQGKDSLSSPTV
jgi:hypothetical protein